MLQNIILYGNENKNKINNTELFYFMAYTIMGTIGNVFTLYRESKPQRVIVHKVSSRSALSKCMTGKLSG